MPTMKESTDEAEAAPSEHGSEGSIHSDDRATGSGINFSEVASKETQMHIFRGMSELAMALDSMIPRSQMPEEAKQHAKAAKRELLLMLRSLIDAKLNCVTDEAEKEPKLKKIEVE